MTFRNTGGLVLVLGVYLVLLGLFVPGLTGWVLCIVGGLLAGSAAGWMWG